jgi:hydroxyacyl-ACP dehydratase HTD2-like protein with hotdog domain
MNKHWNEIHPATELPTLTVVPSRMQLFMFSAATWNRHHVHYSRDAAVSEGLPDVVVHRALLGDFLARLLTNWLGDAGDIRQLNWRVQQSALPDRPLRCTGKVVGKSHEGGHQIANCQLEIRNEQNQVIAAGDAQVEFLAGPAL